jgi:ABC-type branched-subunit amino acid transport system permease subunit
VDPYTSVGFVGVGAIVAAYFANQQGWLNAEDWRFPTANLVGSLLILVSLWTAWNFPSAVIEVIWAAISLYGLARRWRRRQTASAEKRRGAAQQLQPPG